MSGNNKKCFYCNEEIRDRYIMVAVDGKYFSNLFFHKDCLAIVEADGLDDYLRKDLDKIVKYSR